MSRVAFHNGSLVLAANLSLSPADAGFVSAVQITDFCRTYRRNLYRWSDHLSRFRRDCVLLGISLPYADEEMTAAAERIVASFDEPGELALISLATPGELPHLRPGVADLPEGPTTVLYAIPLRKSRYRRFAEGVVLEVVGTHESGLLPSEVKHRSRLHWWMAEHRLTVPGAVATLVDAAGHADTAVGTVLAVEDGAVVVPTAGRVLNSISVRAVREFCAELGIEVREGVVSGRETERFLAGSGFGLAQVHGWIDGQTRRTYDAPGPITTRLRTAWSAQVGVDIATEFLE